MKAVIFDMDGVIVDSLMVHYSAYVDIFKRHGIEFDYDSYLSYTGTPSMEMLEHVFTKHGKKADIKALSFEKFGVVEKNVDKVKPVDGIHDLLKRLHQAKFKMAVATGAHRAFVDLVLKQVGIVDYFQAIVTLENVKKGKPDPEVFLIAANAIGVEPEDCIVLEDGKNGMVAAKKAGMRCIGLVDDKKKEYPCDVKVETLSEITVDLINDM